MIHLLLSPILFSSIAGYGIGALNKILILMILFLVFSQIKKGSKQNINIIITSFIILILGGISLINSGLVNFSAIINDSIFLIMIIILSFTFIQREQLVKEFNIYFFKYLEYSLIIHFLFILTLYLTGTSLFNIDYGQYRFKGSMGSSATSIYYLVLLIPFFLRYLYLKEKKYLYLSILLSILIILCGTRIAILAMMFFYFLNLITLIKGIKKIIVLSIFAILAIYILELSLSRLFFNDNYSIKTLNMSGRQLLWGALWDYLPNSKWIGFGYGSTSTYLSIVKPLGGIAGEEQVHNDYLKILFDYGIIGLSLFIYILYSMYKKLNTNFIQDTYQIINLKISRNFILIFLILMITDNVLVYVFYTYTFILFYWFTFQVNKNIKEGYINENSFNN